MGYSPSVDRGRAALPAGAMDLPLRVALGDSAMHPNLGLLIRNLLDVLQWNMAVLDPLALLIRPVDTLVYT